MRKRTIFATIALAACLIATIGFSQFVISGELSVDSNVPLTTYDASGLTKYIDNCSPGSTSFIYDKGAIANSYPKLKEDDGYIASTNTISLGYKDKILNIDSNVHFVHKDQEIQYDEQEFLSGGIFSSNSSNTQNQKNINDLYNENGPLYTIKLVGDVTITNGSALSVGAQIGSTKSSGNAGGVIVDDFVILDLNGHTLTIESGATLNAYGYILDSAINESGRHRGQIDCYGHISAAFVVEDFNGGGNTVGRTWMSTMPFSLYSVPYLSCKTCFYDTASMSCATMLYAGGATNSTIMNLIGNDGNSLMQIESGGKITRDTYNNFKKSTSEFAQGNADISGFNSTYEYDGNITINSLSLELNISPLSATINMAQFQFIIPPYYHFVLNQNARVRLPLTLQFMPGSSLLAKKGSRIVLSSVDYVSKVTMFLPINIASGTSYGGIVAPTEMPPDYNTAFKKDSHSPYYFNRNDYRKYEIEETDRLLSNNARIQILGNIQTDTGENGYGKHVLSGLFNLSDNSYNDICVNSPNSFNCFSKQTQQFASTGGTDAISRPDVEDISTSGFVIQPLVDARTGMVVRSEEIDSKLIEGATTFNFRTGVFQTNGEKSIYLTTNEIGSLSGTITTIDQQNEDIHSITIDNETYYYFRNQFVSEETFDTTDLYIYNSVSKIYSKIENDTVVYPVSVTSSNIVQTGVGDGQSSRTSLLGSDYGDWPEPKDYEEQVTTGTVTIEAQAQVSEYVFSIPSSINTDMTKFNTIAYIDIGSITIQAEVEGGRSEGKWTAIDSSKITTSGSIIKTQKTPYSNLRRTVSQYEAASVTRRNQNLYSRGSLLKFDSDLQVWIKA